jgi:hypothetical protein
MNEVLSTSDAVAATQMEWLAVRRYLDERRVALAHQTVGLYRRLESVGGTALLARQQWLLDQPLPLDQVTLVWHDADPPAVDGSEPESAAVRPLRAPGRRFARYSDAFASLTRPRVFENRSVYRLISVNLTDGAPQLGFGLGRYFDGMNVGEAAAHEYAAAARQDRAPTLSTLPLRSLVGDPIDPARRAMNTAITTVTVRRSAADAEFLLHWRDPAKVVANPGLFQVLPVGVFQPAGSVPNGPDFSLWRGMVREFSEELTGAQEHHDVRYEDWPLYRALQEARHSGQCRVYLLGLGVDPLSLATDVLTVAVIDALVFDELFGQVLSVNSEGTTTRVSFREAEVERLALGGLMQPAGAAALTLAWQHRDVVLGR